MPTRKKKIKKTLRKKLGKKLGKTLRKNLKKTLRKSRKVFRGGSAAEEPGPGDNSNSNGETTVGNLAAATAATAAYKAYKAKASGFGRGSSSGLSAGDDGAGGGGCAVGRRTCNNEEYSNSDGDGHQHHSKQKLHPVLCSNFYHWALQHRHLWELNAVRRTQYHILEKKFPDLKLTNPNWLKEWYTNSVKNYTTRWAGILGQDEVERLWTKLLVIGDTKGNADNVHSAVFLAKRLGDRLKYIASKGMDSKGMDTLEPDEREINVKFIGNYEDDTKEELEYIPEVKSYNPITGGISEHPYASTGMNVNDNELYIQQYLMHQLSLHPRGYLMASYDYVSILAVAMKLENDDYVIFSDNNLKLRIKFNVGGPSWNDSIGQRLCREYISESSKKGIFGPRRAFSMLYPDGFYFGNSENLSRAVTLVNYHMTTMCTLRTQIGAAVAAVTGHDLKLTAEVRDFVCEGMLKFFGLFGENSKFNSYCPFIQNGDIQSGKALVIGYISGKKFTVAKGNVFNITTHVSGLKSLPQLPLAFRPVSSFTERSRALSNITQAINIEKPSTDMQNGEKISVVECEETEKKPVTVTLIIEPIPNPDRPNMFIPGFLTNDSLKIPNKDSIQLIAKTQQKTYIDVIFPKFSKLFKLYKKNPKVFIKYKNLTEVMKEYNSKITTSKIISTNDGFMYMSLNKKIDNLGISDLENLEQTVIDTNSKSQTTRIRLGGLFKAVVASRRFAGGGGGEEEEDEEELVAGEGGRAEEGYGGDGRAGKKPRLNARK